MQISVGFLTPLFLSLVAVVFVHGQLQTGYISIDCGSPVNFKYVDIDTGISYTSDEAFISTGINKNISSEYAYPNNPNLAQPLSDLRSFPYGNKNCYTLTPAAGKSGLYLIRALFLYGNYDGQDKLPEFDLYLDVNLWSTVKFSNASDAVTTEIIIAAESDTISVCLVNKGLGIPFISGLELRPLNSSIYGTEFGNRASLVLFKRLDSGYANGTGRYKDDIYDRIWTPFKSLSWDIISTSSAINSNENGYKAPLEVISTAAMPHNASDPLELSWTADSDTSKFYVYMYFAEVQQLQKNQTRKFNISWNGTPLMFGPLVPRYLFAATVSNSEAFVGKEHLISIYKTEDSTLPPILNAIEIYMAKQFDEFPTFSEDVDAVLDIKRTYQVNKSWVGDPCGPKNYTWEGLGCNYSVTIPPRIVSLNLTSSGLSGAISASFGSLSAMESLDLSNNHLTGAVPEFLEELKSLKFLNLEGNQLSGQVPKELLQRSKAGLLTLRVDEQNLCSSGSCKNKKNIVAPVVASVLSAFVLSVALLVLWILRRKRKSKADAYNGEGKPLPSKKRQFTYAEVVNITSNFQDVIGKGGFGFVYRGSLKDGTQVAVKMLSPSSTQGSQQFQTEAELLMRVHHRNLASFIGYCDDGTKLALIYEYMANGNLKDYLSYKNSHTLTWEMRLRIAIDAAQGYLDPEYVPKLPPFSPLRYYNYHRLNEKSDVYSFGVVLLELITGQQAIIKEDETIHIIQWVSPMIERGDLTSIVDQRLNGEFDKNSAWKALEVAMACTTPSSINRATMSFVLTELKQCLDMELPQNRERKQGFTSSGEIYKIGSYNSSEIYSISTATDESFTTAVFVHGQVQIGYISIDCGASPSSYTDPETGIRYTSDEGYIGTGVNMNVASEYNYPSNPNLAQPLADLRSFPHGNKNCYALTLDAAGNNGLYLIRALFMYGNYDGEAILPEFDLYLDVNHWSTIKFSNASEVVTTEIISAAVSDTFSVCLVNKGLGIPFISGLELRPLNSSIYGTEFGNRASLVLFKRLDIGYLNGTGRYKDDIYDRFWSPYNSPSWDIVSTSSAINTNENGYKAPLEVISTAAVPRNASDPLELSWTADADTSKFYAYLYFAEVQFVNQTRKFNISWNGSPMFGPVVPRPMYAATISNSEAFIGKEHRISIHKTEDATLPPILNAIEIYMAKQLDELPTFSEDVDAVLNIKRAYQLNKLWVGDPCEPRNYTWEGLECNYSVSVPPRIISLNLSSSGLSGMISASFGSLSAMESLDLSNNHLTGAIPEFLKELKSLKFLNLEGNQLTGYVPKVLVERSKARLLTLRVDKQNLCSSGSCKNKKNIVAPVVASVLSAFVLSVALIILWIRRRKQKLEADAYNGEGKPLPSKKRQFTYAEVVNITGNFEDVIGKGGFGSVYRGEMKDGTQVAVKMLSASSTQGSDEFQTEAELLMRVHHRNLVSFIGYCDDGTNMSLIYEYMANGNLKDYLSHKNSQTLNWEMRLRIAIDAAQGLEYLHYGCKPPIIHRDVKTANILLSENMDAKIADFGLSKTFPTDGRSHLLTTVMGTTGYLDPEYYGSQRLTEKSDVYSFGVVILELITGQNAIIREQEGEAICVIHIVNWVSPMIQRGDISSIVDQRLHGKFDANSVQKALEVAMACTRPSSINRPTMSFVLTELKHCLDMELSHNMETMQRYANEEIYYNVGTFTNSSESYSISSATDASISSPFVSSKLLNR
ncbi:hypothetical protein COLO4_18263 [Corchorus olitorius]|uniref:non-specific serine/threonine protein kinase n=1 Tax=Corchorus olitorius TaxID=93759 RepID=A0A1R3J9T0_9ROSI|nr:hypothetical protein COLO4_18263 [Corchorus olitorius]